MTVSKFWQNKLRIILNKYTFSLNEYLILEAITKLQQSKSELFQNEISIFAAIDISVASVTFKLLENKKLIIRNTKKDNRKKIIEMLDNGNNLYNKVNPLILEEETKIFSKLQNEVYNFTNSLKLLLGRSLRIKAEKIL